MPQLNWEWIALPTNGLHFLVPRTAKSVSSFTSPIINDDPIVLSLISQNERAVIDPMFHAGLVSNATLSIQLKRKFRWDHHARIMYPIGIQHYTQTPNKREKDNKKNANTHEMPRFRD